MVLTHGDYCLPNIFGNDNRLVGFIDVGCSGIVDKWSDLTSCIWSLNYNFKTNGYGKILIDTLGIPYDSEKYDFYILLNKLF